MDKREDITAAGTDRRAEGRFVVALRSVDLQEWSDVDLLQLGDEAMAAARSAQVLFHSDALDAADFVILKKACVDYLTSAGLEPLVDRLGESTRTERGLREVSELLKQRILDDKATPLPALLRREIDDHLNDAARVYGAGASLRVNISCSQADLPLRDIAEMTYRGPVHTADELYRLIRRCYSELFTLEAIEYRQRNAYPHESAAVAVLVQKDTAAEAQ